jgi:hypothetical protein
MYWATPGLLYVLGYTGSVIKILVFLQCENLLDKKIIGFVNESCKIKKIIF